MGRVPLQPAICWAGCAWASWPIAGWSVTRVQLMVPSSGSLTLIP
jgi:hypothetical protein